MIVDEFIKVLVLVFIYNVLFRDMIKMFKGGGYKGCVG